MKKLPKVGEVVYYEPQKGVTVLAFVFQIVNNIYYLYAQNKIVAIEVQHSVEKNPITMEYKIGEIFKYKGEWCQCIKGGYCRNCDFYDKFKDEICFSMNYCALSRRSDHCSVAFKKLEKIGKPFAYYIHGEKRIVQMQEYKLYDGKFCIEKEDVSLTYISDYKHKTVGIIAIEIKQIKEDSN